LIQGQAPTCNVDSKKCSLRFYSCFRSRASGSSASFATQSRLRADMATMRRHVAFGPWSCEKVATRRTNRRRFFRTAVEAIRVRKWRSISIDSKKTIPAGPELPAFSHSQGQERTFFQILQPHAHFVTGEAALICSQPRSPDNPRTGRRNRSRWFGLYRGSLGIPCRRAAAIQSHRSCAHAASKRSCR
jgi:hypothetical protein